MKLAGSMTEEKYRSDLLGSRAFLLESSEGASMRRALGEIYGKFVTAYVLSHTPEQGEDIFRVLVDGNTVVGLELHQSDGEPPVSNVSKCSLKDYERAVSKQGRLQLAVALDLCKKDMA